MSDSESSQSAPGKAVFEQPVDDLFLSFSFCGVVGRIQTCVGRPQDDLFLI